MKKLFITLLVIVLTSGLILGGCAEEAPVAPTTPAPAAPTPATPTPAAPTPATPTPEAPTPEAPTPEAPTPEAPTPEAPEPQYGGTLRFVYHFSPMTNIGWPMDINGHTEYVINFVYAEPLVFYKADATVEPWLATSWEISDDNKAITFDLRKGVKFHDGTDFNADAVKFNFDAAIAEEKSHTVNWESIDVIDDYTVRLNLKMFQNSIWSDLTGTSSMIVSATPAREKGIDYAREHPCGTGPFKFVSFVRDEYVKFERNPDYWQTGKPYIDKLEFWTVVDEMTYQSVLKAGEGDILGLVAGKTMNDMKQAGFLTYHEKGGTDYMSFDSANPDSIFSDIRVRQAMEYAIDKQAIAATLGYGYSFVNNQLPSPFLPHHDFSIEERGYDLNKAKELLTAAGYPNGFQTKWIKPPWFGDAPLIIQQSLKTINVEMEVEEVTNAKYWELARTGWKDAILAGSTAPNPNFAAVCRNSYPPYGGLHVSVKYPDGFKEMVDDALAATDPETQKQLNFKLINALYDEQTFVFYVSNCRGYVVAPYVHDGRYFEAAQYQYWNPADIWLSKE